MAGVSEPWYAVKNVDEVESPSLLVYPERVEENIRRMITIAGSASKLRPHAKTHKLGEVAALQIAARINKFKVATITEAEVLARAGAVEVLLAYQPVGPNVPRFLNLIRAFPGTKFACLLDDQSAAIKLSKAASQARLVVPVCLDVDCGQHRTGIPPDDKALDFYRELCRLPGLEPSGLHAYDGHVHTGDPKSRKLECDAAFAPVEDFRAKLKALGLPVTYLVAGGTPTFPIHARRPNVECSPGTCVFWDFSYSSRLTDLDFLHAALVLTRVVSKTGKNRVCLDLGHKAIASENPHPRVHFLNEASARAVSHSEEHLVIETEQTNEWRVGDRFYGVPWHICPTVALHARAIVVRNGKASEQWRIEARDRHLRI